MKTNNPKKKHQAPTGIRSGDLFGGCRSKVVSHTTAKLRGFRRWRTFAFDATKIQILIRLNQLAILRTLLKQLCAFLYLKLKCFAYGYEMPQELVGFGSIRREFVNYGEMLKGSKDDFWMWFHMVFGVDLGGVQSRVNAGTERQPPNDKAEPSLPESGAALNKKKT